MEIPNAAFVIVIPARLASVRLPGKLLLDIDGRSLLEHTWRRAVESDARRVVIAADDERLCQAAESFGAEVVLTSAAHISGSDRIAECATQLGLAPGQVIVNLQGDEPLMPAACIRQVAALLSQHPDTDVATLYARIEDPEEVTDPNVVKVVARHDGSALLFSRAPIPMARDHASIEAAMAAGIAWRRHLGLYAYRRSALEWFTRTPATPLERVEKLEQLRFLEYGRKIVLARAEARIPPGVDTARDLERVRAIMRKQFK